MRKFTFTVLIVLFTCGANTIAQKSMTEAEIRQKYDAARRAHDMGFMLKAGEQYCEIRFY